MLRISPGETLSAVGHPLCEALNCIIRDHERDPALRMSLLRGIDSLLQNEKQGHEFCGQHGLLLLETVIIPPLIWRAGVHIPLHPLTHCLNMCMLIFTDMGLQASPPLLYGTAHCMLCIPCSSCVTLGRRQ